MPHMFYMKYFKNYLKTISENITNINTSIYTVSLQQEECKEFKMHHLTSSGHLNMLKLNGRLSIQCLQITMDNALYITEMYDS